MGGDIDGRERARPGQHLHDAPARGGDAGRRRAGLGAGARGARARGAHRERTDGPRRRGGHRAGDRRRPGHPRAGRAGSSSRKGFRVALASGGEEALRLAREVRPDAITLDVLMPGMDGWAVLSALKADPALADIPVIMLTLVDDRGLGVRPRRRRLPHQAHRPRAADRRHPETSLPTGPCWWSTTTPGSGRCCAGCSRRRASGRWRRRTGTPRSTSSAHRRSA